MEEKLHIPVEQIPALCLELYSSHGTTMAGLVVCSTGSGRLTFLACKFLEPPWAADIDTPAMRCAFKCGVSLLAELLYL